MADVQELIVKLQAQTESLHRELAKADGRVNQSAKNVDRSLARFDASFARLDQRIGRFTRSAAAGLGAIGVTLGAGALLRNIQATVGAVAQLGDLAARIGVSAEALQAWRHAADVSGSSARTLDEGLEQLNRRLGEPGQV